MKKITKKEMKAIIEQLRQELDDHINESLEEVISLLRENDDLQNRLNIANRTVKQQMDAIQKNNSYITALEGQLKIQDTAINRKQTIIRYLENGEG